MTDTPGWLPANWPAPGWLQAGTSLRSGGVSESAYRGLNLGTHVNDDDQHVRQNRQRLLQALNLPAEPCWLNQVHGNRVIDLDHYNDNLDADGSYTIRPRTVCAVLTADCVPVLICDRDQQKIAAVHAGWRGISQSIIDSALQNFSHNLAHTMAWIGPHICSRHYEIDDRVRQACLATGMDLDDAFTPARHGHWYADLGLMVKRSLINAGIAQIYHTEECTYGSDDRFYSHRRDGITGRMATLIWMQE